jgi:cysteine desulfurase/selenocysteine lyase
MSSGSQKWQMSPQGTGFLYITESFQRELQQAYVGWLGVEDPWQFQRFDQPLAPTAKRYEGGSLNSMGIIGMREALETILEFGPEHIEGHILSLTRRIIDRIRTIDGFELVSPDDDTQRAGIVTVRWHAPRDLMPVFVELQKQRIDISLRMNALRFSPHFYNSPDEIDQVVEVLRTVLSHA